MPRPRQRLALGILTAGVLLVAILAAIVLRFRAEERRIIDQTIIGREADVLYPEALQQLTESEASGAGQGEDSAELLTPVLKTANQDGMLAVVIYDAEGAKIQAAPASLLLPDLSPSDYPRLLGGEQISRYTPDFRLGRYFAGSTGQEPVLEVLLPLHGRDPAQTLGFVQYLIDATKLNLAQELTDVDGRFNRETAATLAVGTALIGAVLAGGYLGLRRAQRLIAERNERLIRANFELTLAAKASAIGQITSHLIHGLQGPVAGLRAVMARPPDESGVDDWQSAAHYAERLQAMIQETVALLGDTGAHISYLLTGRELVETIRRRNAAAAADRRVALEVAGGFEAGLDSHRGSLVCLIAANLIQNAIAISAPGQVVSASLQQAEGMVTLLVTDEGPGIPPEILTHMFEPGRSGRSGGTGLGLAISQLLARQIGASLSVVRTGPGGTTFRLTVPGPAPTPG